MPLCKKASNQDKWKIQMHPLLEVALQNRKFYLKEKILFYKTVRASHCSSTP